MRNVASAAPSARAETADFWTARGRGPKMVPMRSAVEEESQGQEGGRGRLHPAVFRGRDGEFQALDRALERAVTLREPQFVTVLGTLGMGKTRLWAEWLGEMTRPGVRV